MSNEVIIPEFEMYEIDEKEKKELESHLGEAIRTAKDRFRAFTDVLGEYMATGEWKNHSENFLSMIAKACFLRGMYGYNQILAKKTKYVACQGYAAASLCRQSLDPRWINNLQNYVNQAWQSKKYIVYAELAGVLAALLFELGYTERAKDVAFSTIERVTETTKNEPRIKKRGQIALLDCHLLLAHIAALQGARDEALIRLNAALKTARTLDHKLALAKIAYEKAFVMETSKEYEKAFELINIAKTQFELMGYLDGLAQAMNLNGFLCLATGQFQEARDEFEEQMLINQQLNNQIGLIRTLINTGEIDKALGQLELMEKYNMQALELSQEAEYMRGIVVSTINLGAVALMRGDRKEAIRRYVEATDLCKRSGMKNLHIIACLLTGDVFGTQGDHKTAIKCYNEARRVAKDVAYPLLIFLSEVSVLLQYWNARENIPQELKERIRTLVGPSQRWISDDDNNEMRFLRQRILEDEGLQSKFCVFFNPELDFQCRVDRTSFRKECYGNIYWKGGLCPFLKKFLDLLDNLE